MLYPSRPASSPGRQWKRRAPKLGLEDLAFRGLLCALITSIAAGAVGQHLERKPSALSRVEPA
jgi:hypothetical protein